MKYLPNLRIINVKKLIMQIGVLMFGLFLLLNHETFLSLPDDDEEEIAELAPPQPKHVDAKQLDCLAKNIFFEAGSEPEMGKAAVARVVMNRIKHGFGPNPCTVVYQTSMILVPVVTEAEYYGEPLKKVKLCQFSWVCEGHANPNKNDPRYKASERIAYNVLAYDSYKDLFPNTVLFFHNLWVNPMWPYHKVAKIGNHIFYSKYKQNKKQMVVQNMQNS